MEQERGKQRQAGEDERRAEQVRDPEEAELGVRRFHDHDDPGDEEQFRQVGQHAQAQSGGSGGGHSGGQSNEGVNYWYRDYYQNYLWNPGIHDAGFYESTDDGNGRQWIKKTGGSVPYAYEPQQWVPFDVRPSVTNWYGGTENNGLGFYMQGCVGPDATAADVSSAPAPRDRLGSRS